LVFHFFNFWHKTWLEHGHQCITIDQKNLTYMSILRWLNDDSKNVQASVIAECFNYFKIFMSRSYSIPSRNGGVRRTPRRSYIWAKPQGSEISHEVEPKMAPESLVCGGGRECERQILQLITTGAARILLPFYSG